VWEKDLRRIREPEREGVTAGYKTLQNEELHNVQS
jgi:hypothetical protein